MPSGLLDKEWKSALWNVSNKDFWIFFEKRFGGKEKVRIFAARFRNNVSNGPEIIDNTEREQR